MDYNGLVIDLISDCEENCADCKYLGETEVECTITQKAASAIIELMDRVEYLESKTDKLKRNLKLTRAMLNAKKVAVPDTTPEQIEKAKIDAKVYLEIMDFANWMKYKIEEYKRSKEV